MYHKQAGHMSRPPSPNQPRPTHVPLSIRTTITPTQTAPQQQGQSSSPPNPTQQPYPSYPLTISSEKFPKALKLYNKYWMEKSLAQRTQETQQPHSAIETTGRLNIPPPGRSRSVTTPGSSRAYTPSVSNSAYDGVTESVVSFTGEESPSSATPNGSTELIAFNGERVRQRIRRPLTPVSKAKAALIRHLESCWVCRGRRVPCPLEHHDIGSLERARQAKTRQRAHSVQQSRSSNASSLNAPSGLQTVDQPASGGSLGQMASLLGVGLADQLLETPSSDPVSNDPQSPALPDPLSEIPSYGSFPNPANLTMPTVPFPDADLYANYQDGQMVTLGVLRGYFFCTYHDGCQQPFEDLEALQTHAETHLSYNRIEHPLRSVCCGCQFINNFPTGTCYNCLNEGTIETRVYGSFIRMPTYQRYGPDGHDFLRNDSSAPFFPYGNFSNTDFGREGGTDNGNYTTGGMNQGGFYNYQNNNFENPGPQNDSENDNGYNTPRSSDYPFQGNWARHRAKASPLTARYWYAKFLQTSRHHKFLLLTLLLLVACALLFKVHEWMLTKSRTLRPSSLSHPNLPVFGFVGVLASFTMSYTYMKKIGVRRVRRAQCRAHRRPLHDLAKFSFHYRQTAPNTFARGYVFS